MVKSMTVDVKRGSVHVEVVVCKKKGSTNSSGRLQHNMLHIL